MEVSANIIVSEETKQKAYEEIEKRLNGLGLEYSTEEKEVTFTEIKVTLKLSELKMIKRLFTIVRAPKEEIKYLSKIKSVVEATAKDILYQLFQIIGAKK